MHWSKNKTLLHRLTTVSIVIFPFCLYFIPLEWLLKQHSICLFKTMTGTECYGCGITRAVLFSMHFQFKAAFHYNPLVVFVMPLLIFIWLKTLRKSFS